MSLKTQILDLKQQGIKQSDIAKQLNCSTGTVSYHCNPKVKEHSIAHKRKRRKLQKSKDIHPFLDKELNIYINKIDWRFAESTCQTRLIELGYEVFLPTSGGGEIDMIAFKDGDCFKIQVKSTTPTNKDFIDIALYRSSGSYNNKIVKSYENIDFFLIYDGNNIYKIDSTDLKSKNINLRYKVPSNNQIKGILMAKDFIF